MKHALTIALVLSLCPALGAAPPKGKLLFADDFNRKEKDDAKEELGHGWKTNSKSRAKGNKQVDLKDGAIRIERHAVADHGVSVVHDAGFQDGAVELRFMLEGPKDKLGLNFADLQFKEVHAGHLCMASVTLRDVQLNDLKTGVMDLKIRTQRKAGKKLGPEVQKMLKTKAKKFPRALKAGQWYTLRVQIAGDTMSAWIDGKAVGTFKSAGIAHPTKRTLRLAVAKVAWVDDLKIYRMK